MRLALPGTRLFSKLRDEGRLLYSNFPADWDRLGTSSKAQAWLIQKRLVFSPVRITRADAARLRTTCLRGGFSGLSHGSPAICMNYITRLYQDSTSELVP